MTREEERTHWSVDHHGKVDQFVDSLVVSMVDQDSDPAAYMAIDLIFRPYIKWLQAAHANKTDPTLARASVINLLSLMILETSTRMYGREDNGRRMTMDIWFGEFMLDLRDELIHDVEMLRTQSNKTN